MGGCLNRQRFVRHLLCSLNMLKRTSIAQRSGRPSLGVRSWNILLLAVLLDNSGNQTTPMFDLLSAFSAIHHAVLRAYTQSAINPVESATTDINHAYIAIKLWLLLAQRKCLAGNGGNATPLMVWNELWPPFEAMIGVLETDFQLGMSMVGICSDMKTWVTDSTRDYCLLDMVNSC